MRDAFLILSAALLSACSQQEPKISVSDARVVASPGGSAAYFTIRNEGGSDRLVAVDAPGTGEASLHQTTMSDGVMRMRPLGGVEIAGGETITLAPGAMHVMIMPAMPLQPGGKIALTLHFQRSPDMVVQAPVGSPMGGMAH